MGLSQTDILPPKRHSRAPRASHARPSKGFRQVRFCPIWDV